MGYLHFFWRLTVYFVLLFWFQVSFAEFTVGDISLVSKERITRTQFEYTYSAELPGRNGVIGFADVIVSSTDNKINIIDNTLRFNNINIDGLVISTDTFSFRMDRRTTFNPSALVFDIKKLGDNIAPTIVETNFKQFQRNVPTNAHIVIHFSEPIDRSTLNDKTFFFREKRTKIIIKGIIKLDAEGVVVTFIPDQILPSNRMFTINLSKSGIKDLAGNLFEGRVFDISTDLGFDITPPTVLRSSPPNGNKKSPINSIISVLFDEPISRIGLQKNVKLKIVDKNVPGTVSLSTDGRLITFMPNVPLAPFTQYRIVVSKQIKDLLGDSMIEPFSSTFFIKKIKFFRWPALIETNIGANAVNVPIDVNLQASFDRPISPTSIRSSNFNIFDIKKNAAVKGKVIVSTSGLRVRFIPDEPLSPLSRYKVTIAWLQGFSGKSLETAFGLPTFNTGTGIDNTGLQVVKASLSGVTDAPKNAKLYVKFDESFDAFSVNDNNINFSINGEILKGTVKIVDSKNFDIVFSPHKLLKSDSSYEFTVSSLTDLSGNVMDSFSGNFKTAINAANDKIIPRILEISPTQSATSVSLNEPIIITFSEKIDPLSISSETMPLNISTSYSWMHEFSESIDVEYEVFSNQVRILPKLPFPPNVNMILFINQGIRDLAGNILKSSIVSFYTISIADTIAPTVTSIMPSNGSEDINMDQPIVINFSESLNEETILSFDDNTGEDIKLMNFIIFANGKIVPLLIKRSADNRSVTLKSKLPENSLIQVVITDVVEDLSGNAFSEFISEFSTTSRNFDLRPEIIFQRPVNGDDQITKNNSLMLIANKALEIYSIKSALHITQNDQTIIGDIQVKSDGRVIEFIPNNGWLPDALVKISMGGIAQDTSGKSLKSYQGSFRVKSDDKLQSPSLFGISPASRSGIATNVLFDIEFSEALDGSTINNSTVQLKEVISENVVATTLVLRDSRVIRLKPIKPLIVNTQYFLDIFNGIKDLDGNSVDNNINEDAVITHISYTTGDKSDTTSPRVTGLSLFDGIEQVPINTQLRVRFNEPINPLTINNKNILISDGDHQVVACSFIFSQNNLEVVLVPHKLLENNMLYNLAFSAIEDLSGNVINAQTTTFSTSALLDTQQPQMLESSPKSNSLKVSINSPIELLIDERIDRLSVNASTFSVRDGAAAKILSGNYSVSNNGRKVTFVPDKLFSINNYYRVFPEKSSIQDLAGNNLKINYFDFFSFTTGLLEDIESPIVKKISPVNNFQNVPRNTKISILFNEAMSAASLRNISLNANGKQILSEIKISEGNKKLSLIPEKILEASTLYTITFEGIKDLAGNLLLDTASHFTTGEDFIF